ncbi:uncharacterized protein B0H18DRAFT_1207160 [Fomitopsis serialis]|uniref:uncharacterized protein n=1 Tax=Fomitopsis serialis TaxID=139415 RepID=UPI002007A317|nr:uncharacterized protein B0H18DRAFT_1207160 [Neoantrodia serialis]KAH9935590.1 hypothetical protein B0H18DRAFT_1207160 [Neoantrodia serialis]
MCVAGGGGLDTRDSATRPANLASLFRQPSPRSPAPPSAFPSGLHAIGPSDIHASRRTSRSDLDFEQALRAGGTVVLKESLDAPYTRHPHHRAPTPSPVASPHPPPSASSSTRSNLAPSSSSSTADFLPEEPDGEYHTKRRSMYRSPGTASSPDLATLLRKAKARGSAPSDGRTLDSPTTPSRPDAYQGQRFSTSSPAPSPQVTPAPKGRLKPNPFMDLAHDGNTSAEWVMTSPAKNAKSSVRQKTSAFLGKMLGQSSTRERSRTITSSPSTTSVASYPSTPLMDAFTPPVPPIPPKHRQNFVSPRTDPSDVFSDTSSVNKSLPSAPSDADDVSLVMVERSRSPSPTTTLRQRPTSASNHTRTASRGHKRRSMSVSDADVQKAIAAAQGAGPSTPARASGEGRRPEVWGRTLSGIISDFRGELSQLDTATSLDLRDPTTPARRPALAALRAQSDGATSKEDSPTRPTLKPIVSSPAKMLTPTFNLQPAEASMSGDMTASPPSLRPVSLQHSPIRARSGSVNAGPPRVSSLKYGPRSPQMRSGSGSLASVSMGMGGAGTERLRAQHRSTASTSEPSLVPASDIGGEHITRFALSSAGARSSPVKGSGEDSTDLDARGRELAERCWTEDEDFMAKDKIAEWLGGQSVINKTALRHYIDHFDFSALRLDHAFRRLCAKLFLKAETQQVDRILDEFARRYFDCNPSSIFGSASVVHAVTYSLLLLNTDLHVADLATRMSRGQFVRNTLGTIQMQLQPNQGSNSDLSYDDWTSFRAGSDSDVAGANATRRAKRSDSIASWNSIGTREGMSNPVTSAGTSSGQLSSASDGTGQRPVNGSEVSVASGQEARVAERESKAPEREPAPTAIVHDRNWESEVESLLKEMYNAVKSQQILQPIGSALTARSSTSSLSPHHGALLRQRSLRGQQGDRLANLKRGSIRGLQSILHAQSGASPYSSNSSVDGRASPAPSFANSIEGFHASTTSFLTPAMGFASNLSHTIIRETQEDDSHSMESSDSGTDASITDEELALLGPPWAKEGMLCRKQYWECTGKRAKSKSWMDVFVVIQKGELSMFVFGEHAHGASHVVGGGNWLENAHPVGKLVLAHSLAHALPSPGYNRQRPHCMVLTLSNGGVYFFQAGTEELVNEWVSTCNYWAARQSKEPLIGGVSNMEYGWNRVLDPVTRVRSASEDNFSQREDNDDGFSIRSGRSGRSRMKDLASTVRADKSPWADRTFINEWKPPMPSTVPSNHDEETQLEALQKHVAYLKTELKQHNELRSPMTNLYRPRSANADKSLSNWEKKSQYLLTEIVKYESYIDSLQAAMSLRMKKRGEKALERALVVASPTDDEPTDTVKAKWKGQPEGRR